jgi:hypothetical protein
MILNAQDHARLATLFARDDEAGGQGAGAPVYPGYRPAVKEAPNGDTRECATCNGHGYDPPLVCPTCADSGRVPNVAPDTARYLHVAEKYNPPEWARAYLARAHWEACKVATALDVPDAYYPRPEDGTLRVLEYQSGGFQPEHTDFDLFTIVCYRSTLEDLQIGIKAGKYLAHDLGGLGDSTPPSCNRCGEVLPEADSSCFGIGSALDTRGYSPEQRRLVQEAMRMSPGLHIGEIGELVGLGPATPHRVPARPYTQQSIVYFAMPSHAARLPMTSARGGQTVENTWRPATVGEWLKERLARSRVYE